MQVKLFKRLEDLDFADDICKEVSQVEVWLKINVANLSFNHQLHVYIVLWILPVQTWKAELKKMNYIAANGCETWNTLRWILNNRWGNIVRNEELWRLAKFEKMGEWNCIGSTLNRPVDDNGRQSLDWNRQRYQAMISWRRHIVAEEGWRELKNMQDKQG